MIGHQTSVHDNTQTMPTGKIGSLFVDNTLLHPDAPDANRNGLLNNGQDPITGTKNVNQINRHGNTGKGWVTNPVKDSVLPGIDRDDCKAGRNKIPGHPVAWTVLFG